MKYRSLKKWKYELLEDMEIPVKIPAIITRAYITLSMRPKGFPVWLLTVKSHYHWDGPSGPTFDTPTNMRASLFHDALCQLISEGLLDKKYRKYADELLRTIMLEDQTFYADGRLQVYVMGVQINKAEKMTGLKRLLYLRWGRFRANGYYLAVRGNSKLKGM